ncbi:HAD-IIA family hydrolase [Carboxydothermus pertinax]|uniref:Haloacid dehalogenase n=1 Tax=Carboxydothermus pertinax TaxID=870242 RepID=A0A1L8CUL0_9THEO|nr:HAD-IIA family hydrolase [Carboxydothermus pertinax]GAV22608.1 hypothetical protein cpu_11180 [Carboxydothermus pertinax]
MNNKIKALVFDIDGTVSYGNKIIDGSLEVFNWCKKKGLKVLFLSNSSKNSRNSIYKKLINMGFEVQEHEVMNCSLAAVYYFQRKKINKVFVFGSDELKMELLKNGIQVLENLNLTKYILLGYMEDYTFKDIITISDEIYLGKRVIACNKDRNYPTEEGILKPALGAVVSAIEFSTDKKIKYIGKPNKFILEILLKENNLNFNDVMIVGDCFESDIKLAVNINVPAIFISNNCEKSKINYNLNNVICSNSITEIINILKEY